MAVQRMLLRGRQIGGGGGTDAFRKSHEIEGVAAEQTDYQVLINVNYGAGEWKTASIPEAIHSSCVLSDGTSLLAVDVDGKVYKSVDDGATFTQISTLPDVANISVIRAMFCASNGYVYVGVDRGSVAKGTIYRSIDDGENWTEELEAEVNGDCFWNFCEDAGGNLYASGYSRESPPTNGHAKVWKSTDDGDTWVKIYTFDAANYRHIHEININPHNGWIYALTGDNTGGKRSGIWRSKDGGSSWTEIYGGVTTATKKTSLAFKGDDVFFYTGSDGGNVRVERYEDTGGAPITPTTIWTQADGTLIFWMRKAQDGRLAIGAVADHTAEEPFIAISDDTDWDSYTYLESFTSAGVYTDQYAFATDKFSDNKILLCHKQVSGSDVDGRRIVWGDAGEYVYMNEKCMIDFGDIRFTESDGITELDYWMEQKVDSDYAIFWVKIPTIPADPATATIYIYYGKEGETTGSSGVNTAYDGMFDDFESYIVDDPINTDGIWDDPYAEGMYAVCKNDPDAEGHGKVAYLTEAADYGYLWADVFTKLYPIAIRFWYRRSSNVLRGGYLNLYEDGTGIALIRIESGVWHWKNNGAYLHLVPSKSSTLNTWEAIELRAYGDDLHVINDGIDHNGGPQSTPTVGINKFRFVSGQTGYTGKWYINDFFIRKFVYPEPINGAWGAEEAVVWSF